MSDKAIITCALTGVLTNPAQHPVPVTPAQMAAEARDAYNAGASIMHVHLRRQEPGLGHLPSWDPEVAWQVTEAIRAACPGVVINLTTGIIGKDLSGPLDCLRRVRPEAAACNAGSLNYLKLKEDGQWAWPPMVFDNPVEKIQAMLAVMNELGIHPEFECFDVGIVRSVAMYLKNGMVSAGAGPSQAGALPSGDGRGNAAAQGSPYIPELNFVMGVASGMPCDADLLALLPRWLPENAVWQTTLIGRAEIWPVHQKTAELGGMLRTGLEDTFYLPGGARAAGNGALIEALAQCAHHAGRAVATPAEARAMLGLAPAAA
ncbi:MAG: 3-keto-5-aminohexanoate cleavage protein [Burkholderiaceae bacterium]|nr:3-keto-5-aminohexanoate cleavage protein [Burkholderiaceae bacterium]